MNNALPQQEQGGSWSTVEAFPSLTFDDAVLLVAQPRTNLLFVLEQAGRIYSFQNFSNATAKTLVLDISAMTQGHEDCGLLGMAFHPDFGLPGSSNRNYIYLSYSYSPSPTQTPNSGTRAYNRLSRFTIPDGSATATPGSESILINQYDEDWWHNGGGMFFGGDGFLYLTCGDEGSSGDAYGNAQKITNGLFSGVLRIDVDRDPGRSHPIRRQPRNGGTLPGGAGWTNSFTTNYYIPNDNPWLDAGGGVLEEFFCIGLRSPHRASYDVLTDRIWLGDVGQEAREEVNLIVTGGNYQWSYQEGTQAGPRSKPNPLTGVDKPPLYEYAHTDGNNCVIGGFVYRGTEHAADLYGKYIFGDNGSGRIWAMDYDGTSAPTLTNLATIPQGPIPIYNGLSSFGVDQNQEIYMCLAGQARKIYKLGRASGTVPPPPTLLSQTGVFTNLATLAPNPALLPFTVNSPLWSDNAAKFRWLAVPNDGAPYGAAETIGFSSNGNWSFPTGTVLVKHFELPVNDTNPTVRKRLETRLLVRATNDTWYGLTYKWRADDSDADLLPASLNETNLIVTATGMRTQVWYYPSRADCKSCHNLNAGGALGVRTCQFNGDLAYPATGVTDNQLRALNHIGLFSPALVEGNIATYDKTVAVTNIAATLEHRVRSYLDANCAQCHRPNGGQSLFDARYSTPLANQGLISGPVNNSLGIVGAKVVQPRSPAQSILHVRDSTVGLNQMPPLAKNLVDTNYINVLTEWINTLPLPLGFPAGSLGRIGNTNDSATTDNIWGTSGASINAGRFLAASNMTVAFIRARVLGVPGNYKCAIYTESNSLPHRLLALTDNLTGPATGWQTFPLAAAVTLTNGLNYWLSIWSDDADARVYYTTGGSLRWQNVTYGAWPDTLATTDGNSFNYCIYAYGGAAPVFAATPANRAVAPLTPLTVTNTATDADVPLQTLTYYLLNPPANAAIGTNGIITWTPALAQGGTTNLLTTAVTDGVVTVSNSFQVIVTGGNAAPFAFDQSVTNAEDTVLAITLAGGDVDGPVTNFVVVSDPVHGGLSGTAPDLIYTPDTNYSGADSLAFQVNDGSLTSVVATVSVLVTNINDAPIAAPDTLTRWSSQGVTAPIAALLTNDADFDGDMVVLLNVTNVFPSGATITESNNFVTYWPPFGNTNAGSFDYTITDSQNGFATGLVTVAVVPDPAGDDVLNITAEPGATVNLNLNGVPGLTYTVQFSDALTPPDWQNLTVRTANGTGQITAADTLPEGSTNRFYRTVRGIAP